MQHERTLYPLFVCLALVVCITSPAQVESGVISNPWAKSSMWGSWQDIPHANSLPAYRVSHLGSERSTMDHDWYEQKTNPDLAPLLLSADKAHLNAVMPDIQKAFKFPAYREAHLRNALAEIDYVLGRIVNHPNALALSAMVGKLLDRPKLPIKYYERALKLYPKRAMPWAQYGNFLVELGELEDGIKRLKVAIQIDPNLAAANGWLAWAYEKNGNSQLAEEYTKKAQEKGFKGKLPERNSKK